MREGPLVAGKMRFWHIEKIAGSDIVYTCPPYVLEPLFQIGEGLDLAHGMHEGGPQSVMDKLLKIPFCIQAYDPNGMELEQFNTHPSTISTVEAFSKGLVGIESLVNERLIARQARMQRECGETPNVFSST
jgi:hypothetical protein